MRLMAVLGIVLTSAVIGGVATVLLYLSQTSSLTSQLFFATQLHSLAVAQLQPGRGRRPHVQRFGGARSSASFCSVFSRHRLSCSRRRPTAFCIAFDLL